MSTSQRSDKGNVIPHDSASALLRSALSYSNHYTSRPKHTVPACTSECHRQTSHASASGTHLYAHRTYTESAHARTVSPFAHGQTECLPNGSGAGTSSHLPPIAVMRLIPSSKLQERQQLIASPTFSPHRSVFPKSSFVRHSSPPETVNAGFNLYSKPAFAQVAKSFSCARREKDETTHRTIGKTSTFVHEDILLTIRLFC